ncbi:signal recognition particle-docking protein FtsY [Crocosphaera chwakensis]|uniref:Signal recognition particle receptor FtsY n=1 Tax=Crocosphaera chwakensis CCY0110 TaxID=391612 RepID=A3IMX6_9CHRO|nr:signal recognition particle-docking protein FtsY [Crocosphaera chwakensis]EAZ92229.1 cell division protein; FtsY [Crocosphaera chwakensis CCY0110]
MFNWFRRKINKTESEEVSEPTQQTKTPETEPSSEQSDQEDYLSWAKTAYKNIQQRQTPSTSESEETETPSETTDDQVTEVEPETPQVSQSPQKEKTEETPAWMQKSDRLEALKETAMEKATVEDTTPITFDDEFVWSAKVLAAQGRAPDDVSQEEINWLKRLRQGLGKSRRGLVNQLKSIVGQGPLNEDAVMEIEALLLQADTGIEATDYIISTLQNKLLEEALPPEQALEYLKSILREILDRPLQKVVNPGFAPEKGVLNIWLLTGVNGAGKTTTIGKLAHLAQQSGYNCIIAAADTFRAAAVQQVQVWGERTNTPVIANPGKNTDPAAVVFDGISAAQAREADLLLVDTAGRLQNKKNLMAELAKIRRIIDKKADKAQVESLLVLDATLGQNGLRQAQVFSEAANLSGVVLTKLDGTAKGGVALAVAQQLDLPIRFIGVGEGIEDLRPFSSYEFVEALLNE